MREVYIALFLGFLGLFGYFVPVTLDKYDEDGLTKSVKLLGILCVILAVTVIFAIFKARKHGKIHDQKQEDAEAREIERHNLWMGSNSPTPYYPKQK